MEGLGGRVGKEEGVGCKDDVVGAGNDFAILHGGLRWDLNIRPFWSARMGGY